MHSTERTGRSESVSQKAITGMFMYAASLIDCRARTCGEDTEGVRLRIADWEGSSGQPGKRANDVLANTAMARQPPTGPTAGAHRGPIPREGCSA